MDTEQTNQVNMYKAVTAYLDDHNSVWNGMAPFVTACNNFKAKVTAIDDAAQIQEKPSGAATDKAAARNTLEDVLFLACEALGVLGHTANDPDLIALTDVTPSGLDKMDAEALSNRAASVLTAANARKTELATLDVTQANLDELDQALQKFNAAKTSPRSATVERKTKSASLASLIREASGILRNELDRMVNLFRRTNPDFVAGYKGARVIVNRAASHAAGSPTSEAPQPKP